MDEDFEKEFNNFIEERINQNFSKLSSSQEFQKANHLFNSNYSSFYETLTLENKKKLEDLYAIINKINGYENCIAYKIGFSDSLKILK